ARLIAARFGLEPHLALLVDSGRPRRARGGVMAGDITVFEQAKNPASGDRFLQIVAKPRRKRRVKDGAEPKLTRVAFPVSRLMEFCTKRELQNQTGHSVDQWPLVVFKELMDNALDACEEAEIRPVISVAVTPTSFTITDNGAGIKSSTVKSILDYNIRVSS